MQVFKICLSKLSSVVRNLKGADLLGGKADAVVHVSLGEKEFKTKVVKGNNNPEINETFRFALPAQEKTMHTLYFQVGIVPFSSSKT